MRPIHILAFLFFSAIPTLAAADDSEAEPTMETAAAHVQAQEWDEAIADLKHLVRTDPANGSAWMQLGYAWYGKGEQKKAIKAYQKAVDAGFYPSLPEYNSACSHALLGNTNDAFYHLDKAIEAGWGDRAHMEKDPDLATLRGDPRWERLVARADRVGHPCAYDDHMGDFDFWVGSWTVTDARGVTVGKSTVTKRNADCVVLEEWTSKTGVAGMSMNFYDPAEAQWVQVWRGDRGGIGRFAGGLDDEGRMVLVGTSTKADGTVTHTKGVWTPREDGTVQQAFWSSEDGTEWEPGFEGFYTREDESEDAASSAD